MIEKHCCEDNTAEIYHMEDPYLNYPIGWALGLKYRLRRTRVTYPYYLVRPRQLDGTR